MSQNELQRIETIRKALPSEGLFAEKEWLISPEPFQIGEPLFEELQKLGYRLGLFVKACNQLYQLSIRGKAPDWVARYLDQGKPPELIEFARNKRFREDLPLVIRPDLVLTENGFAIAELDSVPGGIGLTGWLNQVYASLGSEVIGGPNGMVEGFREIMDGGDIIVSQESATYEPEMRWLANQAGNITVHRAETFQASPGRKVYRFFELFDLPNVPCAPALMEAANQGALTITPPIKPWMEEKLWFALFWMRPLREFWRRELGERHWLKLQEVIPYTWIADPTPLPQHAVIPGLEIQRWEELGEFSQKQRELILKISGFSELAWGSRGVSLAQDMPQTEWKKAVEHAMAEFPVHPYILQRFCKGKLVEQRYFDDAHQSMRTMQGRVRLCPYYFMLEGKAQLRGALATICPADKKLLHGMRDAILVPSSI